MRLTRGNRRVRSGRERMSELQGGLRRAAARHGDRVLAAFGILALTWAMVAGIRALRESNHFRLRQVAVEGTMMTSPEDVIRACELRLGEGHLLFESAREIQKRCESDPRFRRVEVAIEMPDRVVVRIEEQDTRMYAATPSGLWKVNRYGEAWGPVDPGDMIAAPLLVGAEAVMTDTERSRVLLREALSLLRTVISGDERMSPGGGPFDSHGLIMAWDEVLGFTVQDTTSGFSARFGHPPFGRKFLNLVQALDAAGQRGLAVEQALLDNEVAPEAVTLRLAPATDTRTNTRGIATQTQEIER